MAGTLFMFLGLAAFARGAVIPAVPVAATAPLAKLEEFDVAPQYTFAYDVQDAITGDSKTQYETRNGDLVQGSYSLIEADGTRRIVKYTADPINGFNAIVSREPATVAAIATPVLPLRPAALTPVALPAAPAAAPAAPSIPAIGPDSDVEVVEARSGPLTKPTLRDQEIQRQQLRQLQHLQDQQRQQQQEQQLRQLQQLQEQQRQQSPSSQIQRQQQYPAKEQQREQQQQQRIIAQPQQQPIASTQLTGIPATRAIITHPYAAYSATYSLPFAYAAPLAPAPALT